MKTFKQNKERIKTFCEKVNESSEETLLKDFQGLGIHKKTYSISDIEEAWGEVITKDAFSDEEYYTIEQNLSFSVDEDSSGSDTTLDVEFTGSINIIEIKNYDLTSNIINELESSTVQDTDRWTTDEIEDSLNDIEWSDHLEVDFSEIEAIVINSSHHGSSINIEYGIDGEYKTVADITRMFDDFINGLNYYKKYKR